MCDILGGSTIGLHPRDHRMLVKTLRNFEYQATAWWWSTTKKTVRTAEHGSIEAPKRSTMRN